MAIARKDFDRYLEALSIAHYVLGALVALMGCLPLIHLTLGIGLLTGSFPEPSSGSDAPPAGVLDLVGGMFVGIASVVILCAWSLAAAMVATGRFLATRRRHTFCLVVGVIESLFAPIGTALGVLTILLLVQEGARERFEPGAGGAAER